MFCPECGTWNRTSAALCVRCDSVLPTIVAAPAGAAVSVKASTSGSTTTYTFAVGAARAVVSLAGDGTLRRLR